MKGETYTPFSRSYVYPKCIGLFIESRQNGAQASLGILLGFLKLGFKDLHKMVREEDWSKESCTNWHERLELIVVTKMCSCI